MVDPVTLLDAAAPPYTPLRYGLLSVAAPVVAGDPHWKNGFLRQPLVCIPAFSSLLTPCNATGGPSMSPSVTGGAPVLQSDVFRVWAWAPCSPVGWGDDLADLRRRTEAALTNGEGRAVEHVFWTGSPVFPTGSPGTVYPHLAANTPVAGTAMGANTVQRQSAATTVTSAAVDVVEALGLLEGALAACYGAEGVIHVPRQALAQLSYCGLVTKDGQQLRTLGGTLVAAYASNDRMAPDGTTPTAGQTYFYATGAVAMVRSDIVDRGRQPAEIIGRTDNSTVYLVERAYAFTWDCCHLAAQVSLGGVVQGTVGAAT
jgi:hypothetical protein